MVMKRDQIDEIKKHAQQVITSYGTRDSSLYARYREMFFMEDENKRPQGSNIDEKDWAITVSPSARNEVMGMVRLLDTSEIHITVKDSGEDAGNSDKIERALKSMLRVSGEYRRARIETDAALSAVLYGPVVLYTESLDDLLAVTKDKYKRRQLEQIRKRSPFLIRSINPEQSYPEWGEYGLLTHTWKYKVRGAVLKDRWGLTDATMDRDYTVYDYYDCEYRVVWADGIADNLFAEAHGLDTIPIVSRYAGGSSLFLEPEKQVQSFLYAKAKSRLDKRENALLTAIATAVNMRGLMGPLLSIDPEGIDPNGSIKVDYTGGVRYLIGKAQQVDDKVIDPVVFEWRALLKEIGGESTIHNQTLGQVNNQGTYSGLAMLSSAGKLPLVDSQRAIEMTFRDIFLNVLQRIKDEGIANDLIAPSEIPNNVELEVTLEPNLPQDKLRNAQVAQSLGDLVSDEWKHSNLLQVGDSAEMRKQVVKEGLMKAIVGGIVQNPEIMQGLVAQVMGMPQQGQAQQGQPTEQAAMMQQGGQGQPPQGQPSPEQMAMMQQMMAQGGGMEAMPQTDPMILPQERM